MKGYATLYPADATEEMLNSNGLGVLSDCISGFVTRERNGEYEIEFEYPVDGAHFSDIALGCLVKAEPEKDHSEQLFEIYAISKPKNGKCTINGEHVSYRLNRVTVEPFEATGASSALAGLATHSIGENPFTTWTDIENSTTQYTQTEPATFRSQLGGVDGSILDLFGGEYDFDNYVVKLYKAMGTDRGVTVEYGKNLIDLEQEESIQDTITGIVPYWVDSDGQNLVMLSEKVIECENADNFPYKRTIPYDFSQDFEEQPTEEQLRERAQAYVKANVTGTPDVSITVSAQNLADTEEYKNLSQEIIRLCDTVTVKFLKLGVNATAKVVSIEYDFLNRKIDEFTLGSIRSNLATTITDSEKETQESIDKSASFLQQALNDAKKMLMGGYGGHVVPSYNADKQMNAIYVIDTTDIATATKGIVINMNGIGGFQDGINGEVSAAMTIDGKIVADAITTGTLKGITVYGDTIKAGIISDKSGLNYWNLETGEIKISLLSQLQQEVDGIDISRTNLLVGTQDYTGWETSGDVTFSMSPNVDGFKEATIINTESGRQSILTGKWAGTLLAGQKYTLSFVSSSQTPYDIRVYAKASDVTVTEGEYTIASQSFYVRFPADSTEKKRSFTFTVSEDKESNYVEVSVPTEYTSQGVTIYAFKLEKGDTATEWTPSYNEGYVVKAEIIASINNDYQSEIKIKADKISLEGIVTANGNIQITEDGSIIAKNGTFTGSEFTFGNDYTITMQSNSDGDGILISGNGEIDLNSTHDFIVQNMYSDGKIANELYFSNIDAPSSSQDQTSYTIGNYSKNYVKSTLGAYSVVKGDIANEYASNYLHVNYHPNSSDFADSQIGTVVKNADNSDTVLASSAFMSIFSPDAQAWVSLDTWSPSGGGVRIYGGGVPVEITSTEDMKINVAGKSVHVTQGHGGSNFTGGIVQGKDTSHQYMLNWNTEGNLEIYVDNQRVRII